MNFYKLILSIFLLFSTSSCGFKVIYDTEQDDSFTYELAAIKISKKRDRLYQQFKDSLYDVLNPDNIETETKYILYLTINQVITSTFTNVTGSSGRNKVTVNITYQLKNIEDNSTISQGSVFVNNDYDVSENRYATYIAEKYTRTNLLSIASQDIRNNIVNDFIEKNYKK